MKSKKSPTTYKKYKKSVNMSHSELKKWNKNKCSTKASLNKKPIKRNLILLNKKSSNWTNKDNTEAKKTISFLARMKKVKSGKPVCNNESKRDIALKNWAYDPNKPKVKVILKIKKPNS